MGADKALRKILVDRALVPLTQEYGNNICTLSETESNYTFAIRNVPNDALIIKCDRFPTTGDKFFRGKNQECKRADYVLISESEKVIMFFELKRSNKSASAKDITAQLKGAKCIMDYCASISSAFLEEHDIFDGYIYKYYKGAYKSPQKRPFGKDNKPDNSTPETARILPGDSAAFGWL